MFLQQDQIMKMATTEDHHRRNEQGVRKGVEHQAILVSQAPVHMIVRTLVVLGSNVR